MDSKDFAKLILVEANKQSKLLNYTQLQKIMYICDGVLLAKYNKNIINENCQVWDYGPVYPKVYKWYSKQNPKSITELSKNTKAQLEVDSTIQEVISAAITKFGSIPASALSTWSHKDGGPWAIARATTGMYSQISKDVMKLFFKSELK